MAVRNLVSYLSSIVVLFIYPSQYETFRGAQHVLIKKSDLVNQMFAVNKNTLEYPARYLRSIIYNLYESIMVKQYLPCYPFDC